METLFCSPAYSQTETQMRQKSRSTTEVIESSFFEKGSNFKGKGVTYETK
jgi:hypothetical protein